MGHGDHREVGATVIAVDPNGRIRGTENRTCEPPRGRHEVVAKLAGETQIGACPSGRPDVDVELGLGRLSRYLPRVAGGQTSRGCDPEDRAAQQPADAAVAGLAHTADPTGC